MLARIIWTSNELSGFHRRSHQHESRFKFTLQSLLVVREAPSDLNAALDPAMQPFKLF